MKKQPRYIARKFLNRLGYFSGAYVYAKVDRRDIELKIADCDRVISLDFPSYDAADFRASLYKAKLLRDTLINFTHAMEEQYVEEYRRGR